MLFLKYASGETDKHTYCIPSQVGGKVLTIRFCIMAAFTLFHTYIFKYVK